MKATKEGHTDVDLKEPNSVYVFRDGPVADAATQEIEGRRYIWVATLKNCIDMLHTAIRASKWSIAEGTKEYKADEVYLAWRKTQPNYSPEEQFDEAAWREYRLEYADDFPSIIEGFVIRNAMSQMGAIAFLTVFNQGYRDDGNVTSNSSPEANDFRERCVLQAIPDAADRTAFNALLGRLKGVRDGLLAHADGRTHEMDHQVTLTTFKATNNAISPEEVVDLYQYARRLFDVVRTANVT
jgi:hypothetical protein